MRDCRCVVVRFVQADPSCPLGRQGDVVVALGGVTYEQAFFLLQIFKSPNHVSVCIGTRADEKFFCKNARPVLCLKKAEYVFLDLPQSLFVHVFTLGQIIQRINTDNTDREPRIVVNWLDLTAPPKGEAMKKNLLVVCLVLLLAPLSSASAPNTEFFTIAERAGEPNERAFFPFSTSAGGYIIRHDGLGEFTSPAGLRRVFTVKVAPKGRLDQVYYLEHQGDLFLLYEVRGHGFYLVRMEQKKRKARWFTPLGDISDEEPRIEGEVIKIGKTVEVSKADGRVVRQD